MVRLKFSLLIQTGFITATLAEDARKLCEDCHQKYFLFILANKYDVWNENKEIKKHKREIILFIGDKILEINRNIILYNKNMVQINPGLTLKEIDQSNINKELSQFYRTTKEETSVQTKEKLLPYLIDSFDFYIFSKVNKLIEKLVYNKDILDLNVKSFGLDEINKRYHDGLYEIVDLYFMGYRATSLLVLGRVFEEIITKYLIKLFRENKITLPKETILNMRFENKLGFLKANSLISEKDWLIVSKLKFDRNIGGHFVNDELKQEAEIGSESTIKLAFKLIDKFDKKLQVLI